MSPTPRSDRRLVPVRIKQPGYNAIAEMAKAEHVTVSEMIRTLLSEAVQARQTRRGSR